GHWDSEPRVIRSPPAHTNQEIRSALLAELRVEINDAPGHLLATGAFKTLKVHHHGIAQILNTAVPQHLRALTDKPGRVHVFHPALLPFTRERQRTYLEKPKIGGLVWETLQSHRELDFHRTPERVFPDSHELFENRGQREDIVLEDRSEAHDANPRPAESVIDGVIVTGVGGAEAVQCPVRLRRIQPESHFPQISNGILVACLVVQVEGPELRLRVRQDIFHG